MPQINRPWEAFVVSIAELMVRGAKSVGTMVVNDTYANVRAFLDALAQEQLGFTKPLYYDIAATHNHHFTVTLYTDPIAFEVYKRIGSIQDSYIRDTLYGFMFGYSPEAIWAYLRANKPSR